MGYPLGVPGRGALGLLRTAFFQAWSMDPTAILDRGKN